MPICPLTAVKMINTLLQSDIEIQRLDNELTVEGKLYEAGSYVISLAQPKMGLIRNLLGRTFYPDNDWTRDRDGSPLRPYDTATHTMEELMGVRVDPVDEAIDDFGKLSGPVTVTGRVAKASSRLVLDGRQNAAFKAVNLLLDRGVRVGRVDRRASGLRPGDFIVSPGPALEEVAEATGVSFVALSREPARAVHDVSRMRVGMYQRYRGGNIDEGWTRFLLEQFGFPYTSIMDKEIQAGGLRESYDVIILPHDTTAMITGEKAPPRPGRPPQVYPPEYMTGIGDEGIEALKTFVEDGGTLVALGGATDFAISKFGLNVRNVVDGLSSKEFFCPGSTLRVGFDNTDPLAYGMPDEGLVLFWSNAAFEITPSRENDRYRTVVRYQDRDLLQSGWLIGEKHLAKKDAMVAAGLGDGEVILIGFRTQHRAQTHGTFKLLFNTILK